MRDFSTFKALQLIEHKQTPQTGTYPFIDNKMDTATLTKNSSHGPGSVKIFDMWLRVTCNFLIFVSRHCTLMRKWDIHALSRKVQQARYVFESLFSIKKEVTSPTTEYLEGLLQSWSQPVKVTRPAGVQRKQLCGLLGIGRTQGHGGLPYKNFSNTNYQE